jgi:hypothetical protein
MLLHLVGQSMKSPPRIAFCERVEWGKKNCPVATLSLAANLTSGSFFFLLLSSRHGADESCLLAALASLPPGIRWPYHKHVGSLQCTPCLWLKAYTATSPVSMIVFLPYLAESSGASHITQQRRARRFR